MSVMAVESAATPFRVIPIAIDTLSGDTNTFLPGSVSSATSRSSSKAKTLLAWIAASSLAVSGRGNLTHASQKCIIHMP